MAETKHVIRFSGVVLPKLLVACTVFINLTTSLALADNSCSQYEAQVILTIESVQPNTVGEESGRLESATPCRALIAEVSQWNMHTHCPLMVEDAVDADYALTLDESSCKRISAGLQAGVLIYDGTKTHFDSERR